MWKSAEQYLIVCVSRTFKNWRLLPIINSTAVIIYFIFGSSRSSYSYLSLKSSFKMIISAIYTDLISFISPSRALYRFAYIGILTLFSLIIIFLCFRFFFVTFFCWFLHLRCSHNEVYIHRCELKTSLVQRIITSLRVKGSPHHHWNLLDSRIPRNPRNSRIPFSEPLAPQH